MEEINLKPLNCELNFLSNSDGSAIVAQGDTVVVASVNGPLDVKSQNQSIEKATLEVLFSTKGGKPSVGDRYKENAIKQTCESAVLGSLYPRSGVTITLQELEDYGGVVKVKGGTGIKIRTRTGTLEIEGEKRVQDEHVND
ncbi:Exosome complex component RRP46 [Eumeta japonica]|uniref:Exosome complex component RRP46 n=1 Tax=Eumeta variegata TaxID=151549 RepID=A0A4C1YVK6_EUMVA|nr:Exosome complex component RRP46 [Eumeta japonica]